MRTKCIYLECKGEINEKTLVSYSHSTGIATFVCECWSGNIEQPKRPCERHIFIIKKRIQLMLDEDNILWMNPKNEGWRKSKTKKTNKP